VRLIIYGDIHGCLDELIRLRDKIKPKKDDIEITVGDFLAKGPSSIRTLRYLKDNNIQSVLGNHEYSVLRHYKNAIHDIELNRMHYDIANNLSTDDVEYLSSLPIYKRYGNITIIHGGVSKKYSLDNISKSDIEKIISIRYIDKHYQAVNSSKETKEYKFWAKMYDGDKGFVIYGHTPFDKPQIDKHSLGIDTGCVMGHRLSAVVIDRIGLNNNPHYYIESIEASKKYI
jgi:predicted phosphodiesterase